METEPDPDPPFKQALLESLVESWETIRSLWWLWLVGLLAIGMMSTVYWFFTNYGPGPMYQEMTDEFRR